MTRAILIAALAAGLASAAVPAPPWLSPYLEGDRTELKGSAPAEVLLNEEHLEVESNGRAVSTKRYAVRILQRNGRSAAVAREPYVAGSEKVRDFDVWVVRPGGEVIKLGRDSMVDVAAVENDIYNEVRVRVALAEDEAVPGAVFAYQAVIERRMFFLQQAFDFQDSLPVRSARFSLTLPSSWRASAIVLGRGPVEPAISGRTMTWRMDNLAFIDQEPGMPPASSLAPRLGVNLVPGESAAGFAPRFQSWEDVSRWQAGLAEPPIEPGEAIRAKARELTATAATPFDKVRAVAEFVQAINYISVQMGLSRGGGYQPHAATDTLRRRYGDCKDKAALMRSLLKAAGIESHAVAIFSENPLYVRPDWPSPHQFNHMILAVKLKHASPASVQHPAFGDLLLFDPTNPVVPLGQLDDGEQDSHALVIAPSGGALIRTPAAPEGWSRSARRAVMAVDAGGKVEVKFSETAAGGSAARLRPYLKRSEGERARMVARRFRGIFPGAALHSIRVSIQPSGAIRTEMQVESYTVLRPISTKAWLVKTGLVPVPAPILAASKRVHPIRLDGASTDDTFDLEVAEEFEIAGALEPVSLKSPYGSLTITWTGDGRKVRMERRFVLERSVVPPGEYPALKRFLDQARVASSGHLVLEKR